MIEGLYIVAVLGTLAAVSEGLAKWGLFRHLGSALLVILLTAIAANLGIVPTVTQGSPVYDAIFVVVAPLAIFWLLLGVQLRSVWRAGPSMLGLFSLGALGTVLGVVAGMALVGGKSAFGEMHHALGGMFVGTYIGGSINFNAVALEYGVMNEAVLYAGAAVVDNLATTVWMMATVLLPRVLSKAEAEPEKALDVLEEGHDQGVRDVESVGASDLAVLLALGGFTLFVSDQLSSWAASQFDLRVPSILLLTTIALVLAQVPWVQRIRGAHVVGWFAVLIFLAVIGALCDLAALEGLGELAPKLLVFVFTIVTVHGLLVFGGARLLNLDMETAAVASQANIGGGTSALALAKSLDRPDLGLPAILVGSAGNALGTYLGFLAAAWLS